jgi:hypothetical protein
MHPAFRFLLRLRRRALHCYELGMLALLLGIALATTLPADAEAFVAAPPQCGNAQSSAAVIVR